MFVDICECGRPMDFQAECCEACFYDGRNNRVLALSKEKALVRSVEGNYAVVPTNQARQPLPQAELLDAASAREWYDNATLQTWAFDKADEERFKKYCEAQLAAAQQRTREQGQKAGA